MTKEKPLIIRTYFQGTEPTEIIVSPEELRHYHEEVSRYRDELIEASRKLWDQFLHPVKE